MDTRPQIAKNPDQIPTHPRRGLHVVAERQPGRLSIKHWKGIAALAVVYLLTSLLSRFFVISPEILAPVWIPAGVLLAGLLLLPWSAVLPAISAVFLASVAGNWITHIPFTHSLAFSFANCACGLLGTIALKGFSRKSHRISDLRGLVYLMLFGATLANGVGAILGAGMVSGFGYGIFGESWLMWFLSNAWGILIVVPLVSEWGRIRSFFENAVPQAWLELLAISGVMASVAFLVWTRNGSASTYAFVAPFLIFPLLVWIALRFGTAGATVGAFAVSAIVLISTAHGVGRFAASYQTVHTRFIELQVFMTMATICSLVAAAIMSDRERAEVELRYASSILRSSDAAIIGKTLDGIIRSWNAGAEHLYGYKASEVIGRPISVLMPPDHPNDMPAIMERLQRGEQGADYDTVRQRKDGSRIEVYLKVSPILDASGNVIGASSIARDITQRKAAEAALRESETRFRSIYENAAVGIEKVGVDGRLLMVNEALCRMLDYSRQELLKKTFEAITRPEDREREQKLLTPLLQGESKWYEIEKVYLRRDGSPVWVNVTSSAVTDEAGRVLYRISIVQDVSQRKAAEDAAREREERFRAIFENAAVGMAQVALDGRWVRVNDRLCEIVGYTREEMESKTFQEITHPDDVAADESQAQRLVGGEIESYALEKRYLHKDGHIVWVTLTVSFQNASGDQPAYFISAVEDITQRKKAEEALRKSERRLRVLTEALPQLVWTADAMGSVDYVNRRWSAYTGQTKQQAMGHGSFEAVHPDDIPSLEHNWINAVMTGTQHHLEFRLRSKDGQYRWFLARGVPLRNEEGQVERWFGTCTDIHDMKMAQQALIRSEKLASVGRMAMTIAHEINNPLAAVMNTLFLLRSEPGMSKNAKNFVELADGELRRISHITRQALGFYRESTTPEPTSVNDLVDSVTELLKSKINAKHVTVTKELRESIAIKAVGGELRQVISNLLSNAIDAVDDGGHVWLRTSKARDAEGKTTVRITVADDGKGIGPTALPHIFEPFFTTKDAVGTGLGLWVSKQIVDKHRGCIRVRSHADAECHGTVFSVVLPMEQQGEAVNCPASTPTAMAG